MKWVLEAGTLEKIILNLIEKLASSVPASKTHCSDFDFAFFSLQGI